MNVQILTLVLAELPGYREGHMLLLNGREIAFRAPDGNYSDHIVAEVAEALGRLLLPELQRQQGELEQAYRIPGSWYESLDKAPPD